MVAGYNADEVTRQKKRVTYVGAAVNVFLTVIKIGIGFLGQSSALIADGIHSLSDLLSDLFVIIAIKLGSREADYAHPYGHRRFETIATVVLGLGLMVVAGGIVWDGMERMSSPERLRIPSRETMSIALISILANEWLFHYTKRVGEETRSKLLMANAWHHRSDAVSSVIVLFGIAAVSMGYPFADAVAAIIVALMIAKIGWHLVAESVHELVDTSLPEHRVQEIRRSIKTTDGVQGIHLLRTRKMGEDAYVDAHIVVDPRITISEGHMIGDIVRDTLKNGFDEIVDVLVHVDPEDDEFRNEYETPLSRREIQAYLEEYLGAFWQNIDEFRIHYLDGLLELEIMLPPVMLSQPDQVTKIKQQCLMLEKKLDKVDRVFVFFKA